VIQASAELTTDNVKPALFPTPPPARLRDEPDLSHPAKPDVVEQRAPGTSAAPLTGGAGTYSTSGHFAHRSSAVAKEECKTPHDLKSIGDITADISIKHEDLFKPDDKAKLPLPPQCSLGDEPLRARHWRHITFAFTAASTCHKPVYFEEEQLERYGHSWGPVRQSAVSAVHFFGTVPLLPYYMGVYPPNECIYDLGQYRPGSCAPYYLDPFPISVRGALFEGAFFGVMPAIF
jgi:hypothetical protein